MLAIDQAPGGGARNIATTSEPRQFYSNFNGCGQPRAVEINHVARPLRAGTGAPHRRIERKSRVFSRISPAGPRTVRAPRVDSPDQRRDE
jgi:hypothetical protein